MGMKFHNINKIVCPTHFCFGRAILSRASRCWPRITHRLTEIPPFWKGDNLLVSGAFFYFLVLVERKIPIYFTDVIFIDFLYLKTKKSPTYIIVNFGARAVTRKIGQYICKLFLLKVPEKPNKIFTLYINYIIFIMLIQTFKKSWFSARKNSTKLLNFWPIAREILNLRKNSSAMHHGIVTIPPLTCPQP